MIIIGAVITCFVLFRRNAIFYGFVVIWAFYGIHLKRTQIGDLASMQIDTVVLFSIGFVVGTVLFRTKKWFSY